MIAEQGGQMTQLLQERRAAAVRRSAADRRTTARCGPPKRPSLRSFDPRYGGFGQAPKFPHASSSAAAAAAAAARRQTSLLETGASDAGPNGPRRDLRPTRRRLSSLQRRRRMARAALREDALRQRACWPHATSKAWQVTGEAEYAAGGAGNAGLRAPRHDATRKAVSTARKTPTAKGKRESSISGHPAEFAPSWGPSTCGRILLLLRRERGGQFRRPQRAQSSKTLAQAAQILNRDAEDLAGRTGRGPPAVAGRAGPPHASRAATTRCWRAGTA